MASSGNIVQLNIGGTLFQTTKSTLTKFDGTLKTILETDIPPTKYETGAIFIDRSAKHFDLILNFMRDGHVDIPTSEDDRRQLLKEAQYYQLTGLVELCNTKVPMKGSVVPKPASLVGSEAKPAASVYPDIIKFNVRGTMFQTAKSTLIRIANLLKEPIEKNLPFAKDDLGNMFIDRPAKHFDKIISFMQTDAVVFPDSRSEIQEFLEEARYYQLEGLVKLCEEKLQFRSPDNIINFDLILNFMRDGHVDIPTSEDDRRQLLKEAQYYQLTGLVELCNTKVPMKGSVVPKPASLVGSEAKPAASVYPDIIKFNVRGTMFQTAKSTLIRIANLLKEPIEKNLPFAKDDLGNMFIDRPAKHFDKIISFMQTDAVVFPDSRSEIQEFLEEARYYQLEGLVKLCEEKLQFRSPDNIINFDLILNFMRDGHVDIPTSEDDRRQLLKEAQYYQLTGLVELCNTKVPMKGSVVPKPASLVGSEAKPAASVYPDIIKFNVRGTMFQTAKSTLIRIANLLKEPIEKNLPFAKDDLGNMFIDRPAKHFDKIISFMQTDAVVFPDSRSEIQEFLEEARYYQLEGLVKLCEEKLQFRSPDNIINFDLILNFMRDGHVDIPTSEDDRRQLLKEAQYYQLTGLVELCNTKVPMKGSVVPKPASLVGSEAKPAASVYPDIIKFNVRGTMFQTAKSTLIRIANLLKEPIEKNLPFAKDDLGNMFIDRPAKHFDKIISFMQTDAVVFPDSRSEIQEFLEEARYYQLEGLVKLCEEKLQFRSPDNIIKLNIGGTVFKTSRATLTRYYGFFNTMLVSGNPIPVDETGAIFIDRDATYFDVILRYMRYGEVAIPQSNIQEFYNEASFYKLGVLMDKCVYLILPNLCKRRISNDAELIQVVKDAKYKYFSSKPIVVIHYSPHQWTTVFRNINAESFAEKNKSNFETYFRLLSYAQDYNWNYKVISNEKCSKIVTLNMNGFLSNLEQDMERKQRAYQNYECTDAFL